MTRHCVCMLLVALIGLGLSGHAHKPLIDMPRNTSKPMWDWNDHPLPLSPHG